MKCKLNFFFEKEKEKKINEMKNYSSNVPCEHEDEMKKLKSEISEKEGTLDILNLKIDELTKSNSNLQNLNESLKEQMSKRQQKMDKEMTVLYKQIQDLEIKKKRSRKNQQINYKQ